MLWLCSFFTSKYEVIKLTVQSYDQVKVSDQQREKD